MNLNKNMKKNQQILEQLHILKDYLKSENFNFQTIANKISLKTFADQCILSSNFHLLSDQKLKFLQAFKFKILEDKSATNTHNINDKNTQISSSQQSIKIQDTVQNQKQAKQNIKLSNIVCYINVMIQQKKIFLQNQTQWKIFLDMILKIVFGKSYSLQLQQTKKYNYLLRFLIFITNSANQNQSNTVNDQSFRSQNQINNIPQKNYEDQGSQILNFIAGLKTLSIFKALFLACSNSQNYKHLFQLCIIFLSHSYSRKLQQSIQDFKMIQHFLNQFFIHLQFNQSNIEFYYRILKNYHYYFQKNFNIHMYNLFLKVATQMLIYEFKKREILKQQQLSNSQSEQQIKKIEKKLQFVMKQMLKNQKFIKFLKNQNQLEYQQKNFQYVCIANCLMNKQFNGIVEDRLNVNFTNANLYKIFQVLNISKRFNSFKQSFQYVQKVIDYLLKVQQKIKSLKQFSIQIPNPQTQSYLSLNIKSQCKINLQLNVQQKKQKQIICQFMTKDKQILFYQKYLEISKQKYISYFYEQIRKGVKKSTVESERKFKYSSSRKYIFEFLKSKIIISIEDQYIPFEILTVQSFKGTECLFLIGRSGKTQYSGVRSIQDIMFHNTTTKIQKKQNVKNVILPVLFCIGKRQEKKLLKQHQIQLIKLQIDLKNVKIVKYPINLEELFEFYNVNRVILTAINDIFKKFISLKAIQQKQAKPKLITCFKNLIKFSFKKPTQLKALANQIINVLFVNFVRNFQNTQINLQEQQPIYSQTPKKQNPIKKSQTLDEKQTQFESTFQIFCSLQVQWKKLQQRYIQEKQQFHKTIKFEWQFINLALHSSYQLFCLVLDFMSQHFSKNNSIMNKNLFIFLHKVISNSIVLMSDNRVHRNKLSSISQKTSILLDSIILKEFDQQNLQQLQILDIEILINLLSRILKLKNVLTEQNNGQKMIGIIKKLITLIKILFKLKKKINIDYSLNQFTTTKIIQLCITKMKMLAPIILKQEQNVRQQIKHRLDVQYSDIGYVSNLNFKMFHKLLSNNSDQAKTYTSISKIKSLYFPNIQLFTSRYVHFQNYSYYIDKYCNDTRMYTFYIALTNLIGHIPGQKSYLPSLLYYELSNTCWKYFLNNLQKNQSQAQTNNNQFYENSQKSIIQLTKFNFDYLNDNTLLDIAKGFVLHSRLLLIPQINWKYHLRVNYVNETNNSWFLNFIQDTANRMFNELNHRQKKQLSKTITVFAYRTVLSPTTLFHTKLDHTKISCLVFEPFIQQMLTMLILSRQLSNLQISKFLTHQKIMSYLKVLIESLYKYQLKYQKDIENMQLENRKQHLALFQSTSHKIKQIHHKLCDYKNILQNSQDPKFDPKKFIQSNVVQLIEEHFGKIVRSYEIQRQKECSIKEQEEQLIVSRINAPKLSKQQQKNAFQKIKRDRSQKILKQMKLKQITQSPKKSKQLDQTILLQNLIDVQLKKLEFIKSQIQSSSQTKILFQHEFNEQLNEKHIKIDQIDEAFNNSKNQEYIIDQYCDSNGLRPFIKKDKIKITLPKLNENKNLISGNPNNTKEENNYVNVFNHITLLNQNFYKVKAQLLQETPTPKTNDILNIPLNQSNSFRVVYITNTSFYIGELTIHNQFLCSFKQSKKVDPTIYRLIEALNSERRTRQQIQNNPMNFYIKIQKYSTTYIKKSYLKVNNSVEIYSLNKTFFFVFQNHRQRDTFTYKIYPKAALNFENVLAYANIWKRGGISNFQYLMKLNKFSQRSFNDISQYYVFPWTIKQFKSYEVDPFYLKNKENYRDLSLPIGKINQAKFNILKNQYDNAKKYFDCDRPLFLYGSFYSNPAIVSYYLIRLFPFSAHQFQLQNSKFDLPDRLFSSVQKNFDAVYNITADFKQLIPQFYCNPQFLRNRNRYNFGSTQSKYFIDNVQLPKWVKTNTPQQFIFRMRKFLQSQVVTQSLHKWIDLTFGKFSDKSNAQKQDNLYNQNVYGTTNQITQSNKNLSFCNKYLKQFGQIPKRIFQQEHPKSLLKPKTLKKSKSLTDVLKQKLLKEDIKQFTYDQCQRLNESAQVSKVQLKVIQRKTSTKGQTTQYSSSKKIKQKSYILLKQNHLISKNPYGVGYYVVNDDNKKSFDEYKCTDQLANIQSCQIFTIDNSSTQQTYVISIQNRLLTGRKFNTNSMVWKSSLGQKFNIQLKQNIKFLKTVGSYLILVNQLNHIKFYTSQQLEMKLIPKQTSNKSQQFTKPQTPFNPFSSQPKLKLQKFILTHIKTIQLSSNQSIQSIFTNNHLSLICFYTKNTQFYLFDVRQDLSINLRIKFKFQILFDQFINQVHIHNMGYILILTNRNRFVMYNMLGQIIINIVVSFKRNNNKEKQIVPIDAVCFWSQQSSDIIFSVNKGTLYKVDLFDMAPRRGMIKGSTMENFKNSTQIEQYQIFEERNQLFYQKYEFEQTQQKIVDIKIQRRGRHWKLYCLGQKGNIFTLKSKYFDLTKYMTIIDRQRED